MAAKFDVYLFVFIALSYPVVALFWRVLAGLFATSGVPLVDKAGQGLAGVV